MEINPNYICESILRVESINPKDITIDIGDKNSFECVLKRSDSKFKVTVSEDIINNKYNNIPITYKLNKRLIKPDNKVYLKNNKDLRNGLRKLGMITHLKSSLVEEIVYEWDKKLKTSFDSEYIRCDIFLTEKVNELIPISIFPDIDFIGRSLVKFTPSNKLGKDVCNQFCKTVIGSCRLIEWIGVLDTSQDE